MLGLMNTESPRRQDAADAITTSRNARLIELGEAADVQTNQAAALTALADLIANSSVPVGRYTTIWQTVERRLRRDAAQARREAATAIDRVDDIQAAIVARERHLA
jgi:hypothetical protein